MTERATILRKGSVIYLAPVSTWIQVTAAMGTGQDDAFPPYNKPSLLYSCLSDSRCRTDIYRCSGLQKEYAMPGSISGPGCQRETPARFISRTHLQLRPGDVIKRHYLEKIKASPESTGRGMPGAGETVGNRCVGGIRLWQGAKEPMQRKAVVAARAVGDPHAGDNQWGSEELAEKPVAAATRAAGGAPTAGGQRQDAGPEVDPGGDKENTGWGENVGPNPGDALE
ncbi:hypothetical protein Y1Q_0016158 [Alligator mississippiensis]|uniref:Uncharacterized protein n=1 Tax=Alligator mississippiensis TaxID=8496 RepID=A0A151P0Y1_ALLMI|nr:hypothetical protein Y1Q_0016158 [Alligator mississippiensis]